MDIAELDRLDKRLIDLEGATFQRISVTDGRYVLRVKWYGEDVIVSNEEELLAWLHRRKRSAQALGHVQVAAQATVALEGTEYE